MRGRAIAIGASADGIEAIGYILACLPRDLAAPVFVVQHLGRSSSGFLPEILRRSTTLPVAHPAQGEPVQPGRVYVAPPDLHLLVADGRIRLSHGPRENHARPAVDALFRSIALEYGPAAVGVVLTGYLSDGKVGLLAIKDRGGIAIVQDPVEAAVREMPAAALAHVPVDWTLRLPEIGPKLVELVADAPGAVIPGPASLAIEHRIAADIATAADVAALLRSATCTARVCPACDAELYLLSERRIARYRCPAGHAFTDASIVGPVVRTDAAQVASWP